MSKESMTEDERAIDRLAAENERLRAEVSDLKDQLQDANHGMISHESYLAQRAAWRAADDEKHVEIESAEARLAEATALLVKVQNEQHTMVEVDAFLADQPAAPDPIHPHGRFVEQAQCTDEFD